jgi:capsid assembly protease
MARLVDLVCAPWAITPSMYQEVLGIYNRHVRGEKIDLDGLSASLGRPLKNEPKGYEVRDGVALLPIEGVLSKRMNLLSAISGGTSTSYAAAEFARAMEDPQVRAVVLAVDSPGGAVDGTQEFANVVASYRGVKPVVAHTDGMIASAAYWIASAADKLYISGDTTQVGSIGVVATHTDLSGAEAQRGVKTTEITAGKFKRIASQYGALTPEGRAYMQDQVDAIYSAFVGDVARNRGVDVETVLENMAEGRIFIGRAAVEAGLVDGVTTLDALINSLAEGETFGSNSGKAAVSAAHDTNIEAGAASGTATSHKENHMNIETLKAEHPAVFDAIKAEGVAEGMTHGATAERQRIQDVLAQALPGHEALVQTLAFDGKTTGPEAASAVLAAERKARETKLGAMKEDAPQPATPAVESGSAAPQGEDAWKADWEKDADLRAEFGGSLNAYLAFKKAEANGTIRIATK